MMAKEFQVITAVMMLLAALMIVNAFFCAHVIVIVHKELLAHLIWQS